MKTLKLILILMIFIGINSVMANEKREPNMNSSKIYGFVTADEPIITEQPTRQSICEGLPVTFKITA
jgi:hypothetical protein